MILAIIIAIITLPGSAQPAHRAYLPIITLPRVLVEDARPGKPEICMAWSPGNLVDQAIADFGAQFFYHSWSEQPSWIARGGIPVWRSPVHAAGFLAVPQTLRGIGYTGVVKLFNEPDLTGQDGPLTPQDAAAIYRIAKRLLPGAAFVTPNAVSREYLYEFMTAVGDDWRAGWDIVGVHGYETYQLDMWPAEWLEPVIALADAHGSYLWISEVGIDSTRSIAWQRQFAEEFDTSAAQVICWYSPHCGGYSPEACVLNFYQDDMEGLTLTGEILQRVLQGGEWPPGTVQEREVAE